MMKDTFEQRHGKDLYARGKEIEDWMQYLIDSDASEAEKIALIETLWSIMLGFADHGWDIADGEENSGQSLDLTEVLHAAVLYSEDQHNKEALPGKLLFTRASATSNRQRTAMD